MRRARLLLSCEHGGARVPARYGALFRGRERLLASHRGWDPGALELARELAAGLDAPLVAARVTRLLVDLNRSADSPSLFSSLTHSLPERERERVLARHWRPHRARVEALARRLASRGACVHVGIHSFAPRLRGVKRELDLGLLFDPRREHEARVARALLGALRRELPRLRIRANQPYRGTDDGLTTSLRERFPAARYAGLELEVNQRFPRGNAAGWRALRQALLGAFERWHAAGCGADEEARLPRRRRARG